MVHNVVGKPVSGKDFFDREVETRSLLEHLRTQHLLLLAPRRVGKTSLLHRLTLLCAHERAGHAAFVSVADAAQEMDFVRKLQQAVRGADGVDDLLQKKVGARAARRLGRIQSLDIAAIIKVGFAAEEKDDWRESGRHLVQALRALEGNWFLLLDELPIFILNLCRADPSGARARIFLQWFRDLRQGPDDRIHWMLAGSIGLDTIARRFGLEATINDLRPETLGPFSAEVADRFLVALAEGQDMVLSAAVRSRLCQKAEWLIPYYLQLLFAKLKETCAGRTPSPPDVDSAFEALLAPTQGILFDHWKSRLAEVLGAPHDRLAQELLDACAHSADGASSGILGQILGRHVADPDQRLIDLHYLLDVLENDGYLVVRNQRYCFRSSLLREFWRRRLAARVA